MSSSASPKSTHYLVGAYPSWSHTRTSIGLCNTLLHLNPNLHITLLIPSNRTKASDIELAQYPVPERPERLVVIHYGEDVQTGGGMWNPDGGFRAQTTVQLKAITESLVKLEPILDPVTGKSVTPHQIPYTAVIADIGQGELGRDVQEFMKQLHPELPLPPAIGFTGYNTATMAFMFCEELKGASIRIPEIIKASGGEEAQLVQVAKDVIVENEEIMHVPGLWPFHMYESSPVERTSIMSRITSVGGILKMIPLWFDAFVMSWPAVFGQELQGIMDRKFGKLYQVGFQLTPQAQDEWSVESHDGECRAFLDASPPRSVLYISFGSAIYAPTLKQMDILLDVLEELGTRFIMAEGPAPDEIKSLMKERIGKGRSKGILVTWAPQRAILSHSSTGMFLTHGGANSAMETILAHVPMIQWPAGFDQPYVANELDRMGVAKEIIQTRGGANIGRPVARDGGVVEGTPEAIRSEMLDLFRDLDGELSKKIRSKMEEMSEVLTKDRESGLSHEAVVELSRIGL